MSDRRIEAIQPGMFLAIPNKVFCVIEDFHYENQTLVAVCSSLEKAKEAAASHNAINVLAHYDADTQPELPRWIESKRGSTSSAYYRRKNLPPGRVWVSKGDCRDYEIREMDVE